MRKTGTATFEALSGAPGIIKLLEQLDNEMRTEILVSAVGKVGARLADAMQFLAPVETGALQVSMDHKEIRYPAQGTAVSIAGPKKKTAYDTPKGRRMPSKYAHLVEYGHVGRDGKFVAPKHPFVRPAVMTIQPVAGEIMANDIFRQMERAVKRSNPK